MSSLSLMSHADWEFFLQFQLILNTVLANLMIKAKLIVQC